MMSLKKKYEYYSSQLQNEPASHPRQDQPLSRHVEVKNCEMKKYCCQYEYDTTRANIDRGHCWTLGLILVLFILDDIQLSSL